MIDRRVHLVNAAPLRQLSLPRGSLARVVASGSGICSIALFLVMGLQSGGSFAELAYSRAEMLDGRQQWTAPAKYAYSAGGELPGAPAEGDPAAQVEVRVYLRGNISREDVYAARLMERMVRLGRHKLAGNAISVSGEGGDADAAMDLGRLLRKMGVSTFVAAGERCLSACVFAFMGGDNRAVAGQLGIHRPYFSAAGKVPDRRSYYRKLQKRLQLYIDELDFPPSLYEAIMAVPPEAIEMLTAAQIKRYYLQGMSPSAEDEADALAAGKLGMSVTDYLERKGRARFCAGFFSGDGVCEGSGRANAAGGAQPAAVGKEMETKPRGVAESADPGISTGAAIVPRTPF